MPCPKVSFDRKLVNISDLERHLKLWFQICPKETQLNGKIGTDPAAWVHFQNGTNITWHLSGDTKREAVKRFLNGEMLVPSTSDSGNPCLRLVNSTDAEGWNCFQVE